ncbi:hypothetical protein COO60DRAFT_886755 [Scenedesmus sp. NREL 46B-D3]|nr:hypothetical protein COO60DRAFT_886755 [Scenedesmus sp. NREL 46B-D3]
MRVEGLGFCMLLLQCCLLSIRILFIYWCVQSAYLNECCAWLQLQLIPTTQFWGQNNSVEWWDVSRAAFCAGRAAALLGAGRVHSICGCPGKMCTQHSRPCAGGPKVCPVVLLQQPGPSSAALVPSLVAARAEMHSCKLIIRSAAHARTGDSSDSTQMS